MEARLNPTDPARPKRGRGAESDRADFNLRELPCFFKQIVIVFCMGYQLNK